MTDSLVGDHETPSVADPGDTLRYTVVITNSGTSDASDVEFDDTIDANTTLVPGSIVVSPIALDDDLSATGNVPIEIAAPGVLGNDAGSGLSVTEVNGSGANVGVATATGSSGSVTLLADGSFTYEPPVGFEGPDTFTYVAGGGDGVSNTGTVTVMVSDMIWFIDNSDAGANEGTFMDPFQSIAAFNTANGASGTAPDPKDGDFIALRTGSGSYSGTDGISLRDAQTLIGEGVAFDSAFLATSNSSAAYQTFAGGSGTAPSIAATGGNGIDVAANNTIRGIAIGNTTGAGIAGSSVGTLTISDLSITGSGETIDVDTGTLAATFGDLTSTSSGAEGIDLNATSGTFSVTGATSLSGIVGNGVEITNSTVTVNFDGGIDVATTGGGSIGILAATDTVTISGVTNTVSAPGGTAISLDGVDLVGGWTFSLVTSSGAAGVDLNNVVGDFTANGGSLTSSSGTAFNVDQGSGNVSYAGTITNSGGKSVVSSMHTAGTVTFSGQVTDTGAGIELTDNTGSSFTFSGGISLNTGTSPAFTATGGGTVNVTGSGNTVTTTTGVGVNVSNTTIGSSGMTFDSIDVSGAANGVILNNTGTTGGFTVVGDGVDSSQGGNDSGGVIANTSGTAIDLDQTHDFQIHSMRIQTPGGDGINALNISGSNVVANTTITDVDASNTSGIRVRNTSINLDDFLVEDASLTNAATGQTMFLVEGGGNTGITMQIRVDGTLFSDLSPTAFQHIAGLNPGDNATVRSFFTNNSVVDQKTSILGNSEVNLLKSHSAVSTFVVSNNTFRNVGLDALNNGILNVGGNAAMSGGAITGLIDGNDFSDLPGKTRAVNVVVEAATGAPGLVDITIDNNRFDDLLSVTNDATAIFVDMRNDVPNSNIRITDNSIGTGAISGTTASEVGGSRDGLFVQAGDATAKTMNLLVDNNTIQVTNTGAGSTGDQILEINADNTNTTINATVTNNTFNNAGTGDVSIRSDDVGSTICLDLNAADDSDNGGNQDVVLVRDASAVYDVEGLGGGVSTDATVETFLNGVNTVNVDAQGDGGGGFTNNGGAACPQPPPPPTILPNLEAPHRTDHYAPKGEDAASIDPAFGTVHELGAAHGSMRPVAEADRGRSEMSGNDLLVAQAVLHMAGTGPGHKDEALGKNASTSATQSGETVNQVLGTIPPGASVTIRFDVAVDDPFPVGPTEVCNQGTITGANFSALLTDDPDEGGGEDPTCTPIEPTVLPVELTRFDYVIGADRAVVLTWQTASESGNAGFEIQHALDRESSVDSNVPPKISFAWTVVDFVSGAGTTDEESSYRYRVAPLDPGKHLFRLKQVDFDGTSTYGPVMDVEIEVPRQLALSPNYPNPFNPSTRLTFTVPLGGRAVVDVYNVLGQRVRRLFDRDAEPGRLYHLTFDARDLSTGDYIVVLGFNGRRISRRMVLLR